MNKIMIQALVLIIALGCDSSAGAMMRTKEGQKKLAEKMSEAKKVKDEEVLLEARRKFLKKIEDVQQKFYAKAPEAEIKELLRELLHAPILPKGEEVPLMPWLKKPIEAYLEKATPETKKALIDALKRAVTTLFNLVKQQPKPVPLVPVSSAKPSK